MIIQARSAIVEGKLRENLWLEITNGKIVSLNNGNVERFDRFIDGVLIPGFIDMHCHGGGGKYFSAESQSDIEIAISTHRGHGTTSLCASLVTEPLDVLVKQIERLVPFAKSGEIVGIHLEGPYLAPARCGAHDPKLLRTPRIEEFERLLKAGQGHIKMVTIAPELEGAIPAIKHLVASGVIAAIGHSAANYEMTLRGVDAGATVVTHFPNAVSKLDDAGDTLAKLAMSESRLTLELILDGHHVDDKTVKRIYAAAGGRTAIVTDAMCAAGSSDGNYFIGALPVTVKDGVARLSSKGTLAGSTLTMDQAFFNMHSLLGFSLGFSLAQAVAATSTIAAKVLGLADRGAIAVGMKADLLEVNISTQQISWVNNYSE
jgi:N-acetylglucosamine-6-phosphate deacetylase